MDEAAPGSSAVAPTSSAGQSLAAEPDALVPKDDTATRTLPGRPLRVGVAGSEPFVVREGNKLDGLSVDIWRSVALKLGLEFHLVSVPTVDEGIERVAGGDLDSLVGPISVTAARAKRVDFTFPYFRSSLAIATRPDSTTLWDRVGPFLSKAFFVGASSLMFVLLIVGALVWLTERRRNPEMFPDSPVKGLANGIWLALVTMTTVGYGDRVPVTLAGRIVTGVWMLIAMLSVSSLTAGIATTLTLAQLDRGAIDKPEQLADHRVAVLRETVGARFARSFGAHTRSVASVREALALLKDGRVDAVVHDRPILQYRISQSDTDFFLSDPVSGPQDYAFAAAPDTDLARQLTVGLLKATEQGEVADLTSKWLGD